MRSGARRLRDGGYVIVLLLGLARGASAAKTDVVVLVNNDRLTGEVKLLSRNQLQLSTDNLGTVNIEWDKVVAVTTAGQFDIAMRDGRRMVGRLGPAPPGQIGIVDAGGGTTAVVTVDIVSLAPIHSGFFQRIDGSLDLGASYTQSSGVAQAYFDTTATYRQPSFAIGLQGSTSVTRQPDSPDTSRYSLNVGYTRFRANRWLVNAFTLLEGNTDLGFDLRTTGALSIGRYVVRSNRAIVLLGAGGSVGRELPVDGDAVTNIDALVVFNASVFAYDYPKTNIDFTMLMFPGLSDVGRVRVNANGKLKRELLRDFFFAISAYDSYDNRPPSNGSRNDVGFSLSLGWKF
jgi:Protein of unknown function, DUF481